MSEPLIVCESLVRIYQSGSVEVQVHRPTYRSYGSPDAHTSCVTAHPPPRAPA
ncbi:hypothetical protein GCM10009557_74140 [Virgisporangium ochraceum]